MSASNHRNTLFKFIISNSIRNISITTWLIALNILVFIISLFIGNFVNYLALEPRKLFENYYVWTLFTSMFLHGGIAHLFFNMFSLYFIGSFIEKLIGRKRFLWFYILSGLIAGLFFSTLSYFFGLGVFSKIFLDPNISAVGASGAIFGLLGLLAVITPRKKVYLIAGPLVAIVIQSIADVFITNGAALTIISLVASVYILISIFLIFSFNPRTSRIALPIALPFWFLPIVAIVPLIVIGLFVALPIGNMAHLGGLLAGLAYGFYLRKRYKRKIILLNRYMQ